MTPKQEAIRLTDRFFFVDIKNNDNEAYIDYKTAKECALIGVELVTSRIFVTRELNYWQQVKAEIESL